MSGTVMLSRSLACGVGARTIALAVELVHGGAQLVVVGGTARWIREGSRWPRDLDVAVRDQEVPRLVTALALVGVHISASTLLRCRQVALTSGWGPLDVFVVEALPAAGIVHAGGCALAVAHE